MQDNKWTLIDASEERVGLPSGQMGNSEVGHTNIGAGRIVYQDLLRISNDIKSGEAKNNSVIKKLMEDTKNGSGRLHLLGLISDGGVPYKRDPTVQPQQESQEYPLHRIRSEALSHREQEWQYRPEGRL